MSDEVTIKLSKREYEALQAKLAESDDQRPVERNKNGNLIWRGNVCMGIVGYNGNRAQDWETVTEERNGKTLTSPGKGR